jgi:hypothetical protein
MTLHFSHMGLTLARTFMFLFLDLLELELFVAVGDATAGHVVRRNLNLDLVAGKDADAVHAHFP